MPFDIMLIILYYEIRLCVCVFVRVSISVSVCVFARNRLSNHDYYGDETFTCEAMSLEKYRRLNFIFKTNIKVLWGQNRPLCQEYCLHHKHVLCSNLVYMQVANPFYHTSNIVPLYGTLETLATFTKQKSFMKE